MKRNLAILFVGSLLILACNLLDIATFDDEIQGPEEIGNEEVLDQPEEDAEFAPPPDDPTESEILELDSTSLLLRDFKLPLPLYALESAWNQKAIDASVLPESEQQILSLYRVMLGDISSLQGYDEPTVVDWPYMDINYDEYSIPIYMAGTDEQKVTICADEGELGWTHPKFGDPQLGGPMLLPGPAGWVRPAGPENTDADAHLVLYDPESLAEWDIYYAITAQSGECLSEGGGMIGDTIFAAGVVDRFDLNGPGANADGDYSARAHGTPLLAGLILPEDIEAGVIAHALAFAIPGPRNTSADPYEPLIADYFYPASTTETDFFSTDPLALAAGQRIRLKSNLVDEEGQPIDESQLSPITRIFLEALRTYGAYLVDNAGGFSFYAEDVHTASLDLSADEVNRLIGATPGSPLPENQTMWLTVMAHLGDELGSIPLAYGPWEEQVQPETATIAVSNFEVVEPASIP